MFQVDRIGLTYTFTNQAFLLFQVKTALIDIRDKGDRLREEYMYRFIFGYFLIELIRIFDRTIFYAGCTTGTFVLDNVSWLLGQSYSEISCLAFYTVNFCKCQNINVWVPADLDQFG